MMVVFETFESIQGEGIWLGMPSFFIRVAGCNLRCRWCDTTRARIAAHGYACSVERLVALAEKSSAPHVVITGGEPTLYADELVQLCRMLRRKGKTVTVESNATRHVACNPHLLSLSPKLNAWHTAVLDAYCRRKGITQIKIVVGTKTEALKAVRLATTLPSACDNIFLMPRARTRSEHIRQSSWLVPLCIEHGVRFAVRAHTLMWNNKPGK